MAVKSLTWNQVNAWRLSQHCLSARLKHRDFVTAVTRTGGIQAQVMSAAELALGARVDGLTPQDVQSALRQERTLVKTWAMRATLHVISASEFPL
jgi:Winged helix DNA-binding domain